MAHVLALTHGGSLDLVYERVPSGDPFDPRAQAAREHGFVLLEVTPRPNPPAVTPN